MEKPLVVEVVEITETTERVGEMEIIEKRVIQSDVGFFKLHESNKLEDDEETKEEVHEVNIKRKKKASRLREPIVIKAEKRS